MATRISIHAPAKGATLVNDYLYFQFQKFQSTLPRRERPYSEAANIAINSISIHAPAKGATTYSMFAANVMSISIHAPAKGATVTLQYTEIEV